MVLNYLAERIDHMSSSAIEAYFESKLHKPFYMVTGDKTYSQKYTELIEQGMDVIRLSDCFRDNDKLPDIDLLREKLRTVDINCDSNKVVVIGVGEYLSLMGSNYAYSLLEEFKDFNLGSAQAVFLLRGMFSAVTQIKKGDPRFDNRRCYISDDIDVDIKMLISSKTMAMFSDTGLKSFIQRVEQGETGEVKTNSDLRFPESLFTITVIESSYDGIIRKIPDLDIPKDIGKEEYWSKLLKDLGEFNYDISAFLGEKAYSAWPLPNMYEKLVREDYDSWTYYLYLIIKYKDEKGQYLRYVVRNSKNQQEFLKNVLYLILKVSHTDKDFTAYYNQRKEYIKKFPEAEVAQFIVENRKIPTESIYKLTDNTEVEREEIVANVSQRGSIKELKAIYPALALYMQDYSFCGEPYVEKLSEYFNSYRRQKVANRLDEDFLEMVDDLAKKREFNRLQTRDELVAKLDDGHTFLCWVDALGAEYDGFISELAQNKGLAVSVNIGRAELPTITSANIQFYENWSVDKKTKISELDETKHKEKGGFKWTDNKLPIHLAKELQILTQVVDQAATVLGLRKYDRYVLAGDHGAARLVVLGDKEEKYETDTKGEHSGRCCKTFDNYDLPFATEENGYIVLADYGRFQGSRKANVEVHGGASLEEVCVPVIELSLKDNELVIEMLDSEIVADYRSGIRVRFFVNKILDKLFEVGINGVRYKAEMKDSNHYDIAVAEIKKAGTYRADIFLDNNLHSTVDLHVIGKSGSVNNDFDDIFS